MDQKTSRLENKTIPWAERDKKEQSSLVKGVKSIDL